MEAHLTTCISTSWVADVPAAIVDADRAAAYFDAATSGFVEFRVGPNPGVVANAIAGLLRWTAGLPDAALANMDRALALADQLRHPYSRAFALHHATVLDVWRSDMASVAARADESRRLADAHDYAIWRALAIVFRGVAAVAHGDADRGVAEMEAGFTLYQELTNPPIFWPALLGIRATIHGWAGDVDHGLELIERARTSLGLGDGHPAAAEIAIAHGDLLLAAPAPDASGAGALFERAAALSAERGARMIELQALTRLVRLGRPGAVDAADALRQLLDELTEGADQPDVVEARAAVGLDAVAAPAG
jgi:ATP/maltotriose-dependent transcriptional regulator MalT